MELIVTRHGETEENIQNITTGWRQGRLSEQGKLQAKKLSESLKGLKLDIIYSSDLSRCLHTANEVLKYHSIPMVTTSLLRERSYGEYEGKVLTSEELYKLPGGLYEGRPCQGESLRDVWDRINKFYTYLKDLNNYETILVMTHAGPSRIFRAIIDNKKLEDLMAIQKLENAAILRFII
ncbi:histidine phosphatase family protein [Candidatus Woesearchaeota archaeon]|nr:histidine phosphatase family protein [Candidatus Woesearchaeota archaeon]